MKAFLVILFLTLSLNLFAQQINLYLGAGSGNNSTYSNNSFLGNSGYIIISKDTTVNGVWDLGNAVYDILPSIKIHGTGSLVNGYIKAGDRQDIFDTTLTIRAKGSFTNRFSVCWFGANTSNADNYWNIQKSINTCLNSGIVNCFIPGLGIYNYSQGLQIAYIYQNNFSGCTLHLYGEQQFWDSGNRSVLKLNTNANWGLNLQLNKGSEIDHLSFIGQFKSPITTDSVYYNTSYDNFDDVSGNNCSDWYFGIVTDARSNQSGINGSTGLKIHDLYVSGFTHLFGISQSGTTANGEILLFENIHLGEGKTGFKCGQAQEKNNIIRGVYSWDRLHTLILIGTRDQLQAGNWSIDGANIAGRLVRIFDISTSGWFPSHFNNIYAESLGSIGNVISTALPVTIDNCIFDFAFKQDIGKQTLLNTNSYTVKVSNTTMRYYGHGITDSMYFSGQATYDNCTFSGQPVNPSNPTYTNSHLGNFTSL